MFFQSKSFFDQNVFSIKIFFFNQNVFFNKHVFSIAYQEEHSQVTITGKRNEQRKMDVSWTKEELGTIDLVLVDSHSIPTPMPLFVYRKDTHLPFVNAHIPHPYR